MTTETQSLRITLALLRAVKGLCSMTSVHKGDTVIVGYAVDVSSILGGIERALRENLIGITVITLPGISGILVFCPHHNETEITEKEQEPVLGKSLDRFTHYDTSIPVVEPKGDYL